MIKAVDNTIIEYYSNGFMLLNMNILSTDIIKDSIIASLLSFTKGKINEVDTLFLFKNENITEAVNEIYS